MFFLKQLNQLCFVFPKQLKPKNPSTTKTYTAPTIISMTKTYTAPPSSVFLAHWLNATTISHMPPATIPAPHSWRLKIYGNQSAATNCFALANVGSRSPQPPTYIGLLHILCDGYWNRKSPASYYSDRDACKYPLPVQGQDGPLDLMETWSTNWTTTEFASQVKVTLRKSFCLNFMSVDGAEWSGAFASPMLCN